MESNDEDLVEREKLVNDGETEEEPNSQNVNNSHPKSPPPIPVSPVIIKKIKSESSNDETTHTTRSPNSASASCSIEQTTSEKGQTTARVTYVNERRLRNDESRFDFKLPPRKFLKEPDVKHMEQALLGLLDDFHSGKLKAFGSGNTMEQMNKIREQQESLAKLHFELATAEEESLENGSDLNSAAARAQENMMQLVQRLEMLSVSIEQLQTSHSDGL
ncbi:coiled-coil domain-containing protein 28A isoform X3 [Condylostylus longicornis]|uniref:coiled-coil domain-containing protein 28A isoform X3 n=1 Tax=Condylostylus longicornis TaxID=2530218 RepID=UPI00244E3078|nr:coiled-coil domain-containing protein 28A isoform X3 [Condylostylus longicornis]